MKTRTFIRCLGLSLGVTAAATFARADDPAPAAPMTSDAQQAAYQNSVAEEAVRKQADKIQAEITELVTELKLNGIDNADLAVLSDASDHLRTLSQEQMQKVVAALQSASMATAAADRQQALVTAYQGQKDVSLQLKSMAVDLAAQESQSRVPAQLESLIARQAANIRQTTTLGKTVQEVKHLRGADKSTHDVLVSEQTSIAGEVDLLMAALAGATPPAAPADGSKPPPDLSKIILDAMVTHPLKDSVHAATQLTTNGPLPDAISKQTDAREYLTAILRVARSNMDSVTRLQEIKAQLEALLGDQRDLQGATTSGSIDGSILADRQARINDRASVTAALLKPLSSDATAQLNSAQEAMDQSSDTLLKASNPGTAAPQEQTVVDDLQKVESMLDLQIAAAQKAESASPLDKLAQLEQLKNDINAALTVPTTPDALRKMQQEAATPSPQAAAKIADAADQLAQAQPNTTQASQSLSQAAQIVQQQEDALKQQAQDYQALQQTSQQIAQAQQQAQQASQSVQSNATQAAQQLSQAQNDVNQAQQQQSLSQDTQQALQQAADALRNATMQAVQSQASQSQSSSQQAQSALQKAQQGLSQQMAQMQGQGQGQSQGPPGQQQQQSNSTQAMATDSPDSETNLLGGIGNGGTAQVMGGLKPKDRDAITQAQAQPSPPEYAPMVEQYLKNLADSSSSNQ